MRILFNTKPTFHIRQLTYFISNISRSRFCPDSEQLAISFPLTYYIENWKLGSWEVSQLVKIFSYYPPLSPTLSQMNPVHTLKSCFFRLRLNYPLIYERVSQTVSFFRLIFLHVFRLKFCMYHYLSHAWYMSRPACSPSSDHCHNIQEKSTNYEAHHYAVFSVILIYLYIYLLVCSLFNCAFSLTQDCRASAERVIGERWIV
jgi:hypothetical protein